MNSPFCAINKKLRTENSGTYASLFTIAASDYSNPRYNLNYTSVSSISSVKSLLSGGKHLVIASMAKGHVTREGHYIVLAGWTTVNGKVYYKVYDPHKWNEYYIHDSELIDGTPNDGFILLSESVFRSECTGYWGFSNKNNSNVNDGSSSSIGGNTSTNTGASGNSSVTLRMGDAGEEVTKLQKLLISKGYSCGSSGADGDFGQGTYKAVLAFQKANGLDVDGIVGTNTWRVLNGSSGTSSSIGGTIIAPGTGTTVPSTDNDVAWNDKIMNYLKKTLLGQAFIKATQNQSIPGFFDTFGFSIDENGVYHAKQDGWQKYMGYNDLYDIGFDFFCDMDVEKFKFITVSEDFMIWIWKGVYLNLGAGAEIVIYYNGDSHWQTGVKYAMPMTLYLKDNKGNTIFDWNPKEKIGGVQDLILNTKMSRQKILLCMEL